jgi:hypothetical protein
MEPGPHDFYMLEPHQNDVFLTPAPAPTTIHRLLTRKIQKFIHFDAAVAPRGAIEATPETNNVAQAPQHSFT